MVYCSTNYLPQRLVQLAVRKPWLDLLLTKLAGAMVHGSLPLATAPQRFPAGRLVFSACHAEGCGFGMVDSNRGSGAATPGRCLRCSVRDWQPTRTGSAPCTGYLGHLFLNSELCAKKSRSGNPLLNAHAGGYLDNPTERRRLLFFRGRKTGQGRHKHVISLIQPLYITSIKLHFRLVHTPS